jgi:hypothetical protein
VRKRNSLSPSRMEAGRLTSPHAAIAWAPIAVTVSFVLTAVAILWPGPYDLLTDPWMIAAGVFAACGALIVSRRARHPIGWLFTGYGLLTSAGLVCFALAEVWFRGGSSSGAAWADAIANVLVTVAVLAIPAALLRFPDGSLPPGRWKWASRTVVLAAAVGGAAALMNGGWGGDNKQAIALSPLHSSTEPWGDVASQLFYPLMVVTMVVSGFSLIKRFRRARGEVRQQMKWLAVAAAYLTTALTVAVLTGGTAELTETWHIALVASAFASVPAAVAVAVLRYRLYDIDRIINRTLVYGALTAILVAGYAGGVLLLQVVLPLSEASPAAVAASTLAMAALTGPLRRRIQGVVDRRFYRTRYDATHAVESFGARLRSETDLDSLKADLLGVVRHTVQPEHASVWLRAPSFPAREGQ